MQVPPNYGRKYSDDFAGVFVTVARSEGTALVPFLLKGVADNQDANTMFQPDRIHPKEAAHPIMLGNVSAGLATAAALSRQRRAVDRAVPVTAAQPGCGSSTGGL